MFCNRFLLQLLLVVGIFGNSDHASAGYLGEIKQSILSVANFTRLYGKGWVLMDGRNIEHTDLYRERLWDSVNLPDARGVFLRSRNYDRDPGTGNSASDLPVGSYQNDGFMQHQHTMHSTNRIFVSIPRSIAELPTGLERGGYFGDDDMSGVSRLNDFDTQSTGGSETQPRSITVNTFIKVRSVDRCV